MKPRYAKILDTVTYNGMESIYLNEVHYLRIKGTLDLVYVKTVERLSADLWLVDAGHGFTLEVSSGHLFRQGIPLYAIVDAFFNQIRDNSTKQKIKSLLTRHMPRVKTDFTHYVTHSAHTPKGEKICDVDDEVARYFRLDTEDTIYQKVVAVLFSLGVTKIKVKNRGKITVSGPNLREAYNGLNWGLKKLALCNRIRQAIKDPLSKAIFDSFCLRYPSTPKQTGKEEATHIMEAQKIVHCFIHDEYKLATGKKMFCGYAMDEQGNVLASEVSSSVVFLKSYFMEDSTYRKHLNGRSLKEVFRIIFEVHPNFVSNPKACNINV